MDKIRINTGSLRNTEKNVQSLLADIQNKITNMTNDIAQMNAMWSGPAHTAFNASFLQDVNELRSLVDSIRGVAEFEGRAASEYDKCEVSVQSLVSAIRV